LKRQLDQDRKNAFILAHSLVFTSPYGDKKGNKQRQRTWERFIDSLSFDKLKDRKDKKVDALKLFQSAGIPIINKSEKKVGK